MESSVNLVSKNSHSYRTILPRAVVEGLKLNDGDRIAWELEAQDGKIVATIKKVD